MDVAREKRTGRIVDAESLWLMVDELGYECPGCGAPLTPCSFLPENKCRPYFSAKEGHHAGCDVAGEAKLVKRARKKSVTTRDGFLGRVPNRLVLRETRVVVDPNGTPAPPAGVRGNRNGTSHSGQAQRPRFYAAETIRRICKTFLNFPHDRWLLGLTVSGVRGTTYQQVFRSLSSNNQIIRHDEARIFYAPVSWKALSVEDEYLGIQLNYGKWIDGASGKKELALPYRVKVGWQDWSKASRRSVLQEINVARDESMETAKVGSKMKGWLFFMGRQDEKDLALFHVGDHRLICCLVDEMIYPPPSRK